MPVNNNMPKKTGNFKVILDTLTGNKETNFKDQNILKNFNIPYLFKKCIVAQY